MRALMGAVLLTLAGCSSATSVATPAPATPQVAAFDIDAVRANFTDECKAAVVVDELFCVQVRISEMSVQDGDILIVPTTLDPGGDDRADGICDQLVTAHFDAEGRDLGYGTVGILDNKGGNLAACSVL